MLKKFPFEIKQLDEDLNNKLKSYFPGKPENFYQIGPNKYIYRHDFTTIAEEIYNFEVRSDDIWIATFPRSGTTLTQEMVWLLVNNFDYEKAKCVELDERSWFLELTQKNPLHLLKNTTEKRIIKTHLPFSFLPPDLLTCGAKIIYIARNPKDVCVSFYYLNKSTAFVKFNGNLKTYSSFFIDNLIHRTPYWSHIEESWLQRENKNVLFLFYENIIENMPDTIKKVASFLGKKVTPDEVDTLGEHLKFEQFQKNNRVNYEKWREIGWITKDGSKFVRKGKTGSWKEEKEFDEEVNGRINSWIKCNLKRIEINFPYNCQVDE